MIASIQAKSAFTHPLIQQKIGFGTSSPLVLEIPVSKEYSAPVSARDLTKYTSKLTTGVLKHGTFKLINDIDASSPKNYLVLRGGKTPPDLDWTCLYELKTNRILALSWNVDSCAASYRLAYPNELKKILAQKSYTGSSMQPLIHYTLEFPKDNTKPYRLYAAFGDEGFTKWLQNNFSAHELQPFCQEHAQVLKQFF